MEFAHAGIATDDLDALGDLYGELLDAPIVHEETIDGLRVAFLDVGGAYFELLEPLPDAEGAIPRYLDSHGPGVHHLALRMNLDVALSRARKMGVELIDEEPRSGAWGHDVAFLHPESTGGVLIEFVEH